MQVKDRVFKSRKFNTAAELEEYVNLYNHIIVKAICGLKDGYRLFYFE